MPALIASTLVLLGTTEVMIGINPRLGHHADVIKFNAPSYVDTPIWLSISTTANELMISTADRNVFRLPLKEVSNFADPKTDESLVAYLKLKVASEIDASALAKDSRGHRLMAVLAVDQRLTYGHIRPVLYALSAANITEYGFETVLVRDSI